MENYWKYIESLADGIMSEREYWHEDCLQDIIHEHCDGSQLVIYHSQAHAFIKWLPVDVQGHAEDMVADCYGGEYLDYDRQASLIAYFALEQMLTEELQERLELENKLLEELLK